MLVGAAEVIDWINRMKEKGIISEGTEIDWSALMRFKRTFTKSVPKGTEQGFTKAGISTFHGRARFIDQVTVKVGDDTLNAGHILIAAGAHPANLAIRGEEHLTTSDQFLELDELPDRIVFVGGGYISFEFAHVAARAGAEVQILHRGARPLTGFDPDLVNRLLQATQDIGVDVRLNTAVEAIEKVSDHLIVHVSMDNTSQTFEADLVVHGAGRVPEIEELDLEKAGIKYERKGVSVNEYLQSVTNPAVYAAGDAAASGGPPLTPVASTGGECCGGQPAGGES